MLNPDHRHRARRHLRQCDPVLRPVIDAVGPFSLQLQRDRFRSLVRAIVAQQISVAAARTIMNRLVERLAPRPLNADHVAALDFAELRAAGLSTQKAGYLHDLAEKTRSGIVRLSAIGRLDDEGVIAQLTQVKGIGRWTAQMFLIFTLGRLDVFPEDDLGIRSAIRALYGLDELPDRTTSREIAAPWSPYASVASWYCWRSLELAKQETAK